MEPTDSFPRPENDEQPRPMAPDASTPPVRSYLQWARVIGQALVRVLTENLLMKAVSLMLAVSLWAMVSEEPDVESSFMVPIRLSLPSRLVETSPPTQTVTAFIKGSRSKLKSISQRSLELPIDLSDAAVGETRYNFDNARIANLPSGVTVVGYSPSHVTVTLDTLITRTLPVRLKSEGSPPDGFELRGHEIKPPRVTVQGPRTELEALVELRTQAIDLSQIQESTTQSVSLQIDSPHIRLQNANEKVQVSLRIEAVEGLRRIEGISVGLVQGLEKYAVSPQQVALQIEGTRKELDRLEAEDIRVEIENPNPIVDKSQKSWAVRFSARTELPGPFRARVRLPENRSLWVRRMEPSTLDVHLSKETPSPRNKAR